MISQKIILFIVLILFVGCNDLNLDPIAEGSSKNWYKSETDFKMSVNDLYKQVLWERDSDLWTDDFVNRSNKVNPMTSATISSETEAVENLWSRSYKAISRATKILNNIEKVRGTISDKKLDQYEANARFVRAAQYARLISHFGDVPFYTEPIGLDKAFSMGRDDKNTILQAIYKDYNYAADTLPASYGDSENRYATKGAAMAMKARIALYMRDYEAARDAAKEAMELGRYELNPDYRTLFLSSTKNSPERIFTIPRSVELGSYIDSSPTKRLITRTAGGWASKDPTYSLFSSFLCTDGLAIDKSPLYDPQNPFANRDPRLAETIVEFQTEWLGYMYQPHPDSLEVLNFKTGEYVKNQDTHTNNVHASFNGLVRKKGISEDYSDDNKADPDIIIMRYADVLLIYAEAKIELNDIDQSVRDAINKVRARAYKVDSRATNSYPAVTSSSQEELRKTIRFERRMELAFEGRRYMDLIRWRIADKALSQPVYGLLNLDELQNKVVDEGLWFFPGTPEIDENAIADFTAIENAGLIKVGARRAFVSEKNYLWPIPAKEVSINSNIEQNPGY